MCFFFGGGLWNRSILFPCVSVSSAFVRRSIRGSCLQSENRCCDHYPVGTWKFLFVKIVWNHLFHFFWEAIFEPRTQNLIASDSVGWEILSRIAGIWYHPLQERTAKYTLWRYISYTKHVILVVNCRPVKRYIPICQYVDISWFFLLSHHMDYYIFRIPT